MNRPFYALAALVAMLTGTAVGIGPARCPSGVSRVAIDARAYCMHEHTAGSHYFVHYEDGPSSNAYDADNYDDQYAAEQGSDSIEQNTAVRYEDSCGRDPLTGQIYSPTQARNEIPNYWSLFNRPANNQNIASTTENESWPADERFASANEAVSSHDVYTDECPELTCEIAAAPQNEIDYENLYTPNDFIHELVANEIDGESERLAQEEYEVEMQQARVALKAWLASMTPVVNELPVAVNGSDEAAYFSEETSEEIKASEDLAAQLYDDAPPAWGDASQKR